MPYTKTEWKNRLVEKPKTFRFQQNADGTVTLIPEEGQVIEPGTPINAANLNNIEKGIADAAAHSADEAHVRWLGTVGGNANALTANHSEITSYKDGLGVSFTANLDSSAAATLKINNLTAIPIKKANGSPVTNLKTGGVYTVRYSAGAFILQGEGGSGTAVASDLLSGKTANSDAGDIVGTMPNRGTFNLALGATVPAGYYSGGTVPSGKKSLSGSVTSSSSSVQFQKTSTDYSSYPSVTVTGLNFTPSYILVYTSDTNAHTTYDARLGTAASTSLVVGKNSNPTGASLIKTGNLTVTATGFTLPIGYSSTTCYWIAIE